MLLKMIFYFICLIIFIQTINTNAAPVDNDNNSIQQVSNESNEERDIDYESLKRFLESIVDKSENLGEEERPMGLKFREKRRLTTFKNVYNRCRIQKRKDKDFCLYLANLYQTVKGFHGF